MSSMKKKSLSTRAGLRFPVGRIHKYLKKGNFASRVGVGAPLALAAVLEYLAFEIMEISVEVTRRHNKTRVSPRHLMLAIKTDDDLKEMLSGVTFARSGILPSIHPELLPSKAAKPMTSSQEY